MTTKTLPLFPLNIVVFPGEVVNLHIFEDRYKQLILDAYGMKQTFGIPTVIKGNVADFGTEVELLEIFKRYKSGEMDIRVRGLKIFRLLEFNEIMEGKLHGGGVVQEVDSNEESDEALSLEIRQKTMALFSALGVDKELQGYEPYDLAHYVGFSKSEEYELLKILDKRKRQAFILSQLERVIPVIDETKRMKDRILLNGEFRHFDPLDFDFTPKDQD